MGEGNGGAGGGSSAEERTPRELQRAATGLQQRPNREGTVLSRAADTLAMDFGLKDRTTGYMAELPARRAASAAADAERALQRDDRPREEAAAPVVPAANVGAPAIVPAPPTVIDQTQTELNRAVSELTMGAGERAARERAVGGDVGTAAGAAAERAAAEQTATTESEREAANALRMGRRATILTTPGGLLAPAEEQTARRRSLIGGRA